jgi:hypothetical protein
MTRITTSFIAACVAAAVLSAPVYAQTPPPATPPAAAQPSTTEKIKTRTKAEWAKLRAEWNKDKAKYATCRDKAKADGLKGTKRLSAIYDCMMQ